MFKSYFTPGRAAAQENGKEQNEKKDTKTKKNKKSKSSDAKTKGSSGNDDPSDGHLGTTVSYTPGTSTPRSHPGSRRASFLAGDADSQMDVRADIMCNWLYQQQLEKQYATGMIPGEGVVVKKSRDSYACYPPQLADMPGSLYDMSMALNVRCAMTVNTRVISVIMSSRRLTQDHIPLTNGLRLQVLHSLRDLPNCKKHHFAAFIEDTQILVVWDDQPKSLLQRVADIEKQLMKIIWGSTGDEDEDEEDDEKDDADVTVEPVDLESGAGIEKRRIMLTSPIIVALTLALCIVCAGLGVRYLALEVATDGQYLRLALVLVIPIQIWVAIFFFQSIVGNLFQCAGPVASVLQNSKFYSGEAPRRLDRDYHNLPHVTVQMPVYKEGLKGVIVPTIRSLKQCISTYEMQGGTANIFVNDDGMQLIPPHEAQARREFYEENNIGWVARPEHDPEGKKGATFLRRGKFKKASNMNYAMMVSNRVEDILKSHERHEHWDQDDEEKAYNEAFQQVLAEDQGRTWAEGNIRIGDYILIIDSDTRVPKDCLLDAVSEMEQCPEVAILQYTAGVLRVSTSFFEGGVKWFTDLIYSAISFAVANGDAPPFVGHNAILRWTAIQDAASYQDEDGYEKFWSESHVSEDFDMSLRVQVAGYITRFAAYTGEGFKEGVSLTVYDELARWEKYAFGCNELMFHPLKKWPTRGPITPLFREFICSGIDFPKKVSVCAYIGTYYAIAAAWPLTVANYFITGWFFGLYDKYYLDSFAIYISVIVVFTAFGNIALAALRYRLTKQNIIGLYLENLKWVPMFTIFLGGLSLHVSQAILCHFVGIDMTWGATAKEIEDVNFLEEIPRLVRRFKGTFSFCALMTALMICGKWAFPMEWQITYFASIFPLANLVVSHFLLPIALNPALMVFAW
ncbi:glycosyl transferase family group 2-domain-containing protein [Microdochium trichocladiopsis]|uniref:Glycosyl transferase family group 2-domain-containing protein n=1 Tax=Microdochium trichocladiopsis TaxID=1682393 RepID=A0A9P9BQZ9_9PEZI|nr:glycosyl transferase family group 2-domain-containing protein [Microdochium trichocladiopsis]KAH7026412.1 glycosyl transferase family group 2-domain-containing protein [Microdochium trichocladiopsis]